MVLLEQNLENIPYDKKQHGMNKDFNKTLKKYPQTQIL